MNSTDLPFQKSALNGMSVKRFFHIAIRYADELYRFYFPEDFRTGNQYPAIKRGWNTLSELKENLQNGGMQMTGSFPLDILPDLMPGAAEKLMAIYRPLNECNLAGGPYEWKISSMPVAEGNPIQSFSDWSVSRSRYGTDPFQNGYFKNGFQLAKSQFHLPCGFPSKTFTDYIIRPICTFKGIWFYPLLLDEQEAIPVKIHLKRDFYGNTQQWTIREDWNAMSPYVVPVSLANHICDEFYITFEPWFSHSYFFSVAVKIDTMEPADLGGRTLTTPLERFILYDTGSSVPAAGNLTTGWFRLPRDPSYRLYLNDMKVLVQPVLPDYVTES